MCCRLSRGGGWINWSEKILEFLFISKDGSRSHAPHEVSVKICPSSPGSPRIPRYASEGLAVQFPQLLARSQRVYLKRSVENSVFPTWLLYELVLRMLWLHALAEFTSVCVSVSSLWGMGLWEEWALVGFSPMWMSGPSMPSGCICSVLLVPGAIWRGNIKPSSVCERDHVWMRLLQVTEWGFCDYTFGTVPSLQKGTFRNLKWAVETETWDGIVYFSKHISRW